MSLFSFFQRKTPPDKYPANKVTTVQGGIRAYVHPDAALKYPPVWRAINLISATIACLPWDVLEEVAGQKRKVRTQVWLMLAKRPNREMSAVTFRETIVAHALAWGNGYAEIERDGAGRPVALWPLNPAHVLPQRLPDGKIVYVVSGDFGQEPVLIPADDMFHLYGLGFNGLTGYSVVSYAAKTIDLGSETEQFGYAMFKNGTLTNLALEHPTVLGDEAVNTLREQLDKSHKGTSKSYRAMILQGGMTAKNLSIPAQDAQFLETRKFQVSDVARWFGVPLHKLSEMDRSTFNNIEHQSTEFVTDAIVPWLTRLEQEADYKLFGRVSRLRYSTNIDEKGLLRGDVETRSKFYESMWRIGSINQNEIRQIEGLPPTPDGNTYFVEMNMQPMERALAEPEPSAPIVEDDEDEDEDEDDSSPIVRATTRAHIRDAAERILRREAGHVKALDYDSEQMRGWAKQFFADGSPHCKYIEAALRNPIEAHFADLGVEGPVDQIIELYLKLHREQSVDVICNSAAFGNRAEHIEASIVGALEVSKESTP